MKCSELVEEISHFSFLLARHGRAHVFIGNEALLLHLTALREKPEMVGNSFCSMIDQALRAEMRKEPCVQVVVDKKESISGLLAWLHHPQHGFARLTGDKVDKVVVLRSPEHEGRQYLVQFMANDLNHMPTTSIMLSFDGVERPIPALTVAKLAIPLLVRIFLRPSPASTAPPPLLPKDLGRLRMLLLAQNAVRSAESPPDADAAVPPHELFGLNPRVWAAESPRYMSKEAYAAGAEHLHKAARTDGLKALAEDIARKEGQPATYWASLVVQWRLALRLLNALFAEPWGQFSEVVSNPHAVRNRHSDPLLRRPGA
ncbi:hypothetical protein JCM9279_006176 [Rhodotorula babjevae]